jgi:ZIP family zinc transporter
LISGYGAFVGANKANLYFAFLGGLSGFAATALGAVAAIALRNIAARTQDIMLGFAAGMMLAASSFSLILPGIEAAQALCGNQLLAACVVVAGLGLGVALMVGLDRFVPHEHEKSGRRGPDAQRINRVWLFVLAITLHNLPEGMAMQTSTAWCCPRTRENVKKITSCSPTSSRLVGMQPSWQASFPGKVLPSTAPAQLV